MIKILFSLFIFLFSCGFAQEKPFVLVSVAPHKFFVEKIAGDTVDVILMVPAGASSHSYEPSPRQMVQAGKAEMWFLLGEPFEAKATKAIRGYHPDLKLIDMRKNLDLLADTCSHCHHHHHGSDPHIWLSPKMAKIQAATITEALSNQYPGNKELYQQNFVQFAKELDTLDQTIEKTLAPLQNRAIMVSHPAYGYFARDYGLKQLSIEFEGKDPSPKQLNTILNNARQNGIKTIFIQYQYSNKAANLVAKELNAKVVDLDPYSEDYIDSMIKIANSFAESGNHR